MIYSQCPVQLPLHIPTSLSLCCSHSHKGTLQILLHLTLHLRNEGHKVYGFMWRGAARWMVQKKDWKWKKGFERTGIMWNMKCKHAKQDRRAEVFMRRTDWRKRGKLIKWKYIKWTVKDGAEMHTCSCMKCDISPSFQDTQSTGGIAAVEVELTALFGLRILLMPKIWFALPKRKKKKRKLKFQKVWAWLCRKNTYNSKLLTLVLDGYWSFYFVHFYPIISFTFQISSANKILLRGTSEVADFIC